MAEPITSLAGDTSLEAVAIPKRSEVKIPVPLADEIRRQTADECQPGGPEQLGTLAI